MRDLTLKREGLIRIFCLVLIAVSVFIKNLDEKILLLIPGIAGLLCLAIFKKQRMLAIVLTLLLLVSIAGYFYANGEWQFNDFF